MFFLLGVIQFVSPVFTRALYVVPPHGRRERP